MRVITLDDYQNAMKLLHLHRTGRARPVGPIRANERRQWVRTWGGKVVQIGQILKCEVKL